MSESIFNNIRILGVSAAGPEQVRDRADDSIVFRADEVQKISQSTGVFQRHVSNTLCTSDLCCAAAERLFEETGIDRESVDALIFVSQTPDHIIPATSCLLQERLNLNSACAAFDIGLGCSGYVYGLWVAASLLASGAANRVILLVGDTSYRMSSPEDRSTALLFGDAGAATLLERNENTSTLSFVLGSDGKGKDHLKIAAGGSRQPWSSELSDRVECEGGNRRAPTDLYMNGAEIFTFTLKRVPPLIKQLMAVSGKTFDEIDSFVFHQANKFMLQHLAKKMKLPVEKVVLALENFGNTSSASVPLAMVTHLAERLRSKEMDLVLAGFGVGYSWAAVNLKTDRIVVPELVLVPELNLGGEYV
jgi:3-oxoacyl-[acyl-carrier-protein] synthase-3